ncbi:MAG: arylesterase [Oleispira sp.]|nr:arylesterase [Oleispira sp.]
MLNTRIHRPFRLVVIMLVLLLKLSLPQAMAGENSQSTQHIILVMGDSISAGFGIAKEQGWVNLLRQKVTKSHPGSQVINASISGETTSGGANRIRSTLELHKPTLVIIELGGNDGLRGTPIKLMKKNLTRMINLSQRAGAKVLLLGMRIPPNYGQTYSERFSGQYKQLALEQQINLVPFLLTGIAGRAGMMQADGIHPTQNAQPLIMQSVWQQLMLLM